MEEIKLKVGARVAVVGKSLEGTVAFIGATQFSSGTVLFVFNTLSKENGSV